MRYCEVKCSRKKEIKLYQSHLSSFSVFLAIVKWAISFSTHSITNIASCLKLAIHGWKLCNHETKTPFHSSKYFSQVIHHSNKIKLTQFVHLGWVFNSFMFASSKEVIPIRSTSPHLSKHLSRPKRYNYDRLNPRLVELCLPSPWCYFQTPNLRAHQSATKVVYSPKVFTVDSTKPCGVKSGGSLVVPSVMRSALPKTKSRGRY